MSVLEAVLFSMDGAHPTPAPQEGADPLWLLFLWAGVAGLLGSGLNPGLLTGSLPDLPHSTQGTLCFSVGGPRGNLQTEWIQQNPPQKHHLCSLHSQHIISDSLGLSFARNCICKRIYEAFPHHRSLDSLSQGHEGTVKRKEVVGDPVLVL